MKTSPFRYAVRSLLALLGLGTFGVCSAYFAVHQNLPFGGLDSGLVGEADFESFCVVIDAGHGGRDGGAQGHGLRIHPPK